MRYGGILWWIGGLIVVGLAGLLSYGLLLEEAQIPVESVQSENRRPVVVASTDIPFRRSITDRDVVTRNLPHEAIPEGAAMTVAQVIGKMSTADLLADEPILIQQLVTPDIVTGEIALSIPDGKTVMSVPTGSQLVGNRLIRPGDKIDLLGTFDIEVLREQGSGPLTSSTVLLQNIEVHALILPASAAEEAAGNPRRDVGALSTMDNGAHSVLLALEVQDALTIRHVLDVGGVVDLVLRPPDDNSVAEFEVVDQFYLAERYQIDLVQSIPRPNAREVK